MYVQFSCTYMCEPWLEGEEVSGDGDGDDKDDRVMAFGVTEDESDNISSLTDGKGSIVVFLSFTTDVEEGKVDDSSSGQFPLTRIVE